MKTSDSMKRPYEPEYLQFYVINGVNKLSNEGHGFQPGIASCGIRVRHRPEEIAPGISKKLPHWRC